MQNFLRQCPRLMRAIRQNFVNKIRIGGQFRALLPRLGKIIPVMFEQRLLQIAVAEAAGAQAVFKVLRRRPPARRA